MKTRSLVRFVALAFVATAVTTATYAIAQRVDARRPTTVVVGATPGPAATFRGDAQRSGLSRVAFPKPPLKVDWRKPVGAAIDQAPLALADSTVVLTNRGELYWYASDGTEAGKVFLQGSGAATSPIVLADGTIVVVSNGDVIGARKEGTRFRVTLGNDRTALANATPLALLDGGFVVAYGAELVVLDDEGSVRTRTTAPEAPKGPLASADGKIYFATETGVVYAWNAGRDVVRIGSFGGALDGGMALEGSRTAYAIVDGSRLVALDLTKGVALPRATLGSGWYLGPPAIRNGSASFMAIVPGRTFAVTIDGNGQEVLRVPITPPSLSFLTIGDAGAAAFVVPPHAGVLVDPTGAIAFASPEGLVGVVDASGVGQALADPPCPKGSRGTGGVAAIVPGGAGALMVACTGSSGGGTLVRVVGSN
ncbi:hypothetical protein BH09MYX1_BH09MYX1_67200 [soil metagenome]